MKKNNVDKWWADNPMTYGDGHGESRFRGRNFRFGSKEQRAASDAIFVSWNQPLHNENFFGRIFDYKKYHGAKVLEIGCGLGYVTEGFSKIANISVLDISKTALERVQSFCEAVYHIDDVESLPTDYFDLIVCHNVVQHVPTESLTIELKHAIRSLATTGTFAVEYVWANGIDDDGVKFEPSWATAGHLCRSDKFMMDLVNKLGGTCKISRTNPVPNHRKIHGLTVLHIQKDQNV